MARTPKDLNATRAAIRAGYQKHSDGELSPVGSIMMTREEVVLEAQDESEVAWYDYAVERTGPFTRDAWEYSRWVHRHIIDLPIEERTQFFAIEHARRESKWN